MNQAKHNYLTKNIFHFDDEESSYKKQKRVRNGGNLIEFRKARLNRYRLTDVVGSI
jgi:hypothetical protein